MTPDPDLSVALHTAAPFTAHVGIDAVSARPEEVVLSLEWGQHLTTTGDVMHGGALMTLADAAGAMCAFLNLPEDATGTTTIESKTNLLRGVLDGDTVTATATPLHVGGTSVVVETRLESSDRLVAKTLQTQLVLRPRN